MYSTIISLSFGTLLGLVYGLFFVFAQRRVFFSDNQISPSKARLFICITTVIRFSFFALILYYLLRWEQINYILLIVSYLGTFWAVITSKKAFEYDRDRSS